MIRVITLAGGLAGAVAASQFPEFSQQYVQRLSGAVDELRAVTLAFDTTARAAGMTRDEALASLNGSGFQSRLRDDIGTRIERYERLSADYEALRDEDAAGRLMQLYHFRDVDLAQRTWDDFRPAVPASFDGAIFGIGGFVAGALVLGLVMSILLSPFRRRRGRGRYA